MRTGAAPKALGRGLGNGVRGEDRASSYANIEPTIRAITAKTPNSKNADVEWLPLHRRWGHVGGCHVALLW